MNLGLEERTRTREEPMRWEEWTREEPTRRESTRRRTVSAGPEPGARSGSGGRTMAESWGGNTDSNRRRREVDVNGGIQRDPERGLEGRAINRRRGRWERECGQRNNNLLHLHEAKNMFRGRIPDFDRIDLDYFMNNIYTINVFEKRLYYLHFLIMFKRPQDVAGYLEKHTEYYGNYATTMFVNFPVRCQVSGNSITPLVCAMLWSDDPAMLRTLYAWGVDITMEDARGGYAEEAYLTNPYFCNHLSMFLANRDLCFGSRVMDNFVHIRREMRWLLGDEGAPGDWQRPRRRVQRGFVR
jgi:hypothetical protein